MGIDYEYVKLFDLKFVSGRNFSKEFPSDSSALILNETASHWLGFPNSDAAIGQQVTSLGILGLSSFLVAQRTKEIAIRKVMGADVSAIVLFLSKGFLLLITISFIIALLLTYFSIKYWLESFAMQMDLSAGLFLLPLLLVMLITGFTISVHVIKAALNNPIDSLRDE